MTRIQSAPEASLSAGESAQHIHMAVILKRVKGALGGRRVGRGRDGGGKERRGRCARNTSTGRDISIAGGHFPSQNGGRPHAGIDDVAMGLTQCNSLV
ncbi:hypothetical protein BV20DRAFT_731475 [Pilatotrama ljubarskyi]|nr:hypothetical protein BV20DRAFT_731475 [Pilatotrama ljubarskyi]